MEFEKSLAAHDDKARFLSEQADELIAEENHMKNEVRAKRNDILNRLDRLKQAAKLRNLNLNESFKYFMFERDCEEMFAWISEKSKLAESKEYLEPANLQVN
jgi:hypothetical protein